MARGWESKSIEDQIAEKDAKSQSPQKNFVSAADRDRRMKRDSLLLSRTHTANALAASRDPRYRELLQRTLDHLDAELAALDPPNPT